MGDFTLGCLLGQPDGSMSFDVSSTADPTNVISFDLLNAGTAAFVANSGDQTQSHSSGQGLMYEVYSSASDVFFGLYYHGFENDAYSRWFPAVTTHGIRMDWWARMNTSAFSGTAFGQIWNQDIPTARIPFSETLKLHRIRTSVVSKSSSAPATIFGFISNNASTGSAWVFIDDVLTQTDEIILHPEYTFREQARIVQASHRTQGGDLHTYTWGKYLAFNVPLRFLADSHSDLINWWWEKQLNLVVTLDTSDSESIYICRITNDRQPIGSRVRPYDNLWEGVLQLESINDGGLAF